MSVIYRLNKILKKLVKHRNIKEGKKKRKETSEKNNEDAIIENAQKNMLDVTKNIGIRLANVASNPYSWGVFGTFRLANELSELWNWIVHKANQAYNIATSIPVVGPAIKVTGEAIGYFTEGMGTYIANGVILAWNAISSGKVFTNPLSTIWNGLNYLAGGSANILGKISGVPIAFGKWFLGGGSVKLIVEMVAGGPRLLSGIMSLTSWLWTKGGAVISVLGQYLLTLMKMAMSMMIGFGKTLISAAITVGKIAMATVGISASVVTASAVGGIIISSAVGATIYTGYSVLVGDDINYKRNICGTEVSANAVNLDTSSISKINGDWTIPGSENYETAKKTWEYWVNKGFSGIAVGGIMGNVGVESAAFQYNAVQEKGDDPNNPASIVGATGTHGYGLYQVSPGMKYGKWSGYDGTNSVENQSDYIWHEYGGAGISKGLKNSPNFIKKIQNSKTISEAVKSFYQAVENNIDYVAMENERNMFANQAYALFEGNKVVGDESKLLDNSLVSTAMTNSAIATRLNNINCGKQGQPADGNIVTTAKNLIGYFTYENLHGVKYVSNKGEIKTLSDVNKNGVTDCSGFVWLVLKLAGYKVPADMAWYTGSMEKDATGEQMYLKRVDISDAKAGDIVIVNMNGTSGAGANGHTLILTSDPVGISSGDELLKSNVSVVQEGGGSHGGVNESTMRESFGQNWWGNSSVIIARPTEKKKE